MTGSVALVADVGEAFGAWRQGDDDALLPLLTDANVACGFHAGDPRTMDRTVKRCLELGVSIGAHPGLPDLVGFGRRAMELTADEVRTDTLAQIGALQAIAGTRGGRVCHVTPHGRLANQLVDDEDLACGVADAVAALDPGLVVVTQEGALARAARARRLRVGLMFLADRAYGADGSLVSRQRPGAVLHDPEEVAARAVRAVVEGVVRTEDGGDVEVGADLVLLHGDEPGAVAVARRVREALLGSGIALAEVGIVLGRDG